ncbi:MAG: DNA-3-methyladenine glycosylase 2 family protein [Gammaproteobacteria bacterium]|nr:DNA-3-methyladenine glycosylase 2 family protein [Gammaproteobacteria bacterium]
MINPDVIYPDKQIQAHAHGSQYIADIDADWAALVQQVGVYAPQLHATREPYESLIRAVAYQQLHGKAAATIMGRFLNLYSNADFPTANEILRTEFATLRACGFSARKVETIQNIANATVDGIVPTRKIAEQLSDEALIKQLITLKGVGRWTVEMMLMFTLARLDILPVGDLGVRQGYRLLKSLNVAPTEKEMHAAGLVCSPYRTIAAWYLWQIHSLPKP